MFKYRLDFKGGPQSGKGARQGPPDDLDEGMTQEKLNQLHDLFDEMDEDGGGGLDMDEFKNAMRQTMGKISDKEIELLFMKVRWWRGGRYLVKAFSISLCD